MQRGHPQGSTDLTAGAFTLVTNPAAFAAEIPADGLKLAPGVTKAPYTPWLSVQISLSRPWRLIC
jgi:hypothetical protein